MALTHRRRTGASAIAVHAAQTFDPSLTWADLDLAARHLTDLPIVLKGILTAEDAARAVAHGVDAIIVSNHGGRQLDGAVPSLRALAEVVDAVGGALPGAARRRRAGRHRRVRGARPGRERRAPRPAGAVGAGRRRAARAWPSCSTCCARSCEHTMALTGRPDLSDIDRSALAPALSRAS